MSGSTGGKDGARARAFAALAVDAVLEKGRTLDLAFAEILGAELPARECSQIKALAFGALRWHHRHRVIIADLLERPLRSRDRVLESLLSVGLYEQIDSRQPDYASVSAAVDASRQLNRGRAAGLINAALRRFQRDRGELLSRALANEEGRYSHPGWLIDSVRGDWPERWQSTLTAALEQPPMWLRVNRNRTSREAYARRIEDACGVSGDLPGHYPDAVLPDRPIAIADLPGFADGDAHVQDAAAQLAATFLAPGPGMRVLDACAAPGGKTTHLFECAGGPLDLVAVDVDPARISRLEENLARSGASAEVVVADVTDTCSWADGRRFDRILVDAPCSSTGVIRRHPDIKFLRREEDVGALAGRQYALLESLWPLLEPGGRLLYATCSILRRENDQVVAEFLANHPDASEIALFVPDAVESSGPGRQLLPGAANTDGFYYALMEREG